MRRDKEMLEKRKVFVDNYINEESKNGKLMREIVSELQERLFLSERTIYNIYSA